MASVKVKFRPSIQAGKEGTIYYRVIHKRVIRQIKTDYRILADEWDEKNGTVTITIDGRSSILQSIKERINRDVKRLNTVIIRLHGSGKEFTANDIVEGFLESVNEQSFFQFMENIIAQLKRLNRERTAETYTATLNSFMRFRKDNDVLLDEINSDLMMEYEAYLKTQGVTMNTVSFYMRILRAVYNRAVEKGLTEQRNPFRHVYTGIDKTVKRAISLEAIKWIKELDLSLKPSLDFARNMFLFSFYTRGMSFIDMAYLRKKDLQDGVLSYRRRKTGQQLFIRWEKCMQEIIDKYPGTGTDYLLPIIKTSGNERQQYRNALRLVNNKLKEISAMTGLQTKLTMYVSRHSWASAARSKNVPLTIISEGMGHDSEATTQIYLASLDNSLIDKANGMILKNL
ncbi:site-specific integrase [Parabacteroides distasonis]|uniref:site-specific integrase n=1 Tax=Parabacteroides distasonis TaxID=823 RepID=UPI0018A053CE|nr:site-specific integrase [Parabacteroides distasonis]MDB9154181.1 site-specific integrase [Parabacteroides distasonis]MDB9158762.1 site-specific integrase [Parabacteroides distasonis]MDB9167486.1 site-specific integrase [Parabacteroides distasonis]MDB9171996.1 site-specific integrase [Parabacteroides distasonis]MDB9195365.1 site-specific integrase [Parabacteroides distasonis]